MEANNGETPADGERLEGLFEHFVQRIQLPVYMHLMPESWCRRMLAAAAPQHRLNQLRQLQGASDRLLAAHLTTRRMIRRDLRSSP